MTLKITLRGACQLKKKLCTFFVVQQNLWHMMTVTVKNLSIQSTCGYFMFHVVLNSTVSGCMGYIMLKAGNLPNIEMCRE